MRRRWHLFVGLLLCFLPLTVQAQTAEPTPTPSPSGAVPIPLVHTVQDGENLTVIATTYNITVADLLAANNLTDADVLSVGQQLIIPGGEGEALPTTYTVALGDTLNQVAALYNTTPAAILDTNQMINRSYQPEMGEMLIIISQTGSTSAQLVTGQPHIVQRGETLPLIAARYGMTPGAIAAANGLSYPNYLFPGQRLRIPAETAYRDLPGEWMDIQLRPTAVSQGSTVSIYVENLLEGKPGGSFAGQSLRFFPFGDGFAALVGIDAFTEPGNDYTLTLAGSGSRPWQPFSQVVPIFSADYGLQQITVTEELAPLLDPAIRQEEDAFLSTFYYQFNETQAWAGLFQAPVTTTVVTAGYGDGRSYNGGPVDLFHTGVDFAGGIGTQIAAPAAGLVVFADALELRGNTVIIDHGLGVLTAYFHLSEIFATVGEEVQTGQSIGAGGSTGLSTGPHLHWEIRVNNVPVDGRQWLTEPFP